MDYCFMLELKFGPRISPVWEDQPVNVFAVKIDGVIINPESTTKEAAWKVAEDLAVDRIQARCAANELVLHIRTQANRFPKDFKAAKKVASGEGIAIWQFASTVN
jgi:hypothetical protein